VPPATDRGAALLEAVVASGLLVVLLGGLWPLVLAARRSTHEGRTRATAALLASQRLAEAGTLAHLRSGPDLVRDEQTGLGGAAAFAPGGTGLREVDIGVLTSIEPGYSEWLDARGHWDAAGPAPGPAARFLRQWAFVAGPEGCVRVWVRVSTRLAGTEAFAPGVQCPWGARQP
jgi:hypothetical protein